MCVDNGDKIKQPECVALPHYNEPFLPHRHALGVK